MWSESIRILNPYEEICPNRNIEIDMSDEKRIGLRHRIAICLRRIANKIDQ